LTNSGQGGRLQRLYAPLPWRAQAPFTRRARPTRQGFSSGGAVQFARAEHDAWEGHAGDGRCGLARGGGHHPLTLTGKSARLSMGGGRRWGRERALEVEGVIRSRAASRVRRELVRACRERIRWMRRRRCRQRGPRSLRRRAQRAVALAWAARDGGGASPWRGWRSKWGGRVVASPPRASVFRACSLRGARLLPPAFLAPAAKLESAARSRLRAAPVGLPP
jgi:hypothetical protein